MTPTIVGIRRKDTDLFVYLDEPRHLEDADDLVPFPYSPSDAIPAAFDKGHERVSEIGAYTIEALFEHPAVEQAIVHQLSGDGSDAQPLLLRLPIQAEKIPWETLFIKNAFLALDPRWPIARLSPYERESPRADFQPPLRVLAVVAADTGPADDSDESEWRALLDALETAKFRVSVKALVASESLLETIKATDSRVVDAEAIFVGNRRDVVRAVKDFKPNILHFFCHGRETGGSPALQLSTRKSRNEAGASLTFEAADIPMATSSELWLVVLNCCGSAKADHRLGSFAFTLVDAGVPAVIGMRQEVEVSHANTFTRSFYEALMLELRKPLKRLHQEVEINWPAMLHQPRMSIAEANGRGDGPRVAAASFRAWTLPALYLGQRKHTLTGRPPPADTQPVGPVGSRFPAALVRSQLGRRVRRRVGPILTDEQRAYAEAKLEVLRDLEQKELGVPLEAAERFRVEIETLERQLYGG